MKIPNLVINSSADHVLVTIDPPPGKNRTPSDICIVVDVSGSMNAEAKLKNESGESEVFGLSLLDIVKHAVKTIVHTLGEEDRLALVVFSTNARTVCELQNMNKAGQARIVREMERLQPEDQTNLWDGLYQGLEVLKKGSGGPDDNPNKSVILLTDGMPNIVPPRGHIRMLRRYQSQNPELVCTVNTFGFGYTLDSEMLEELSVEGNGMYSFIPDSTFVGTSFTNSIANILTNLSTTTQLTLETLNGSSIDTCLGGLPFEMKSSNEIVIKPGPLCFGQTKDIVLRMASLPNDPSLPYLKATLEYGTGQNVKSLIKVEGEGVMRENPPLLETHKLRLLSIEAIKRGIELTVIRDDIKGALEIIEKLIVQVGDSEVFKRGREKMVKDLMKDLRGQVTQAFSRSDWFEKWGKHYLPSLARAHLMQQCNNFKDPGIQHYGGELFETIRDVADDMFSKLPPPTPSRRTQTSSSSSSSSSSHGRGASSNYSRRPIRMSYYNTASNPCFSGDSLVLMGDGMGGKRVDQVRKGDVIMGYNFSSETGVKSMVNNKVKCVVKTVIQQGKEKLVELGTGLKITPWHPVRTGGGQWAFPNTLGKVEERACDAIYSFVLESGHTMVINQVECVTLGHGFTEKVVQHAYFGSNLVLRDLEMMDGWNDGFVVLTSGCCFKTKSSGIVMSMTQDTSVTV